MRPIFLILAAVAPWLAVTPVTAQDSAGAFAEIDRAFACPEALPDDAARRQALGAFMADVVKANPEEGVVAALAYRRRLLEKHHCTTTLQHMQAQDEAVRAGAVLEQAWLPLETGGSVHLSVSTTNAKLFTDPRYPDGHAVDLYARLDMPQPATTSATHVQYDTVVSHNIYYCQPHAYALIENDYFLRGRLVLKDPSPVKARPGGVDVYDLTPTKPGSMNALAEGWACAAIVGSAA